MDHKEKFKVLSEGIVKGKAFETIVNTLSEKATENPSMDMDGLSYSSLFNQTLKRLLFQPNDETMSQLLVIAIIIAVCGEDYKPLTIAECSLIELSYGEKELKDKDLDKINKDIIEQWELMTDKSLNWTKFGIEKKAEVI